MQYILASYKIVFVNFYADWCRFSQKLKPVFEEASDFFKTYVFGKVAFASVDCDNNSMCFLKISINFLDKIAKYYHVNKYPTLKLFRHGELVKKEYR